MIIHAGVSASAPASLVAFAADHMLPFLCSSPFLSKNSSNPNVLGIRRQRCIHSRGRRDGYSFICNHHLFWKLFKFPDYLQVEQRIISGWS